MGEHTSEPWSLETHELIEEGFYSGMFPESDCHELRPEDFERARKCVNACAGMEDPKAEIKRLKDERARMLEVIRVMHASTLNDPTWINTNRVLSSILKECSHG